MQNIRPEGLESYFGQNAVKDKLNMLISVYQKTSKVPEPILVTAKPGMGKSSIVRAFAHSMGVDLVEAFGPMLRKEEDVFELLKNNGNGIKRGSVIFVDECHSISAQAQVMLLPILEDGKLQHGKFNWKFPDWTWVFATTNPGMISKPLYERMVNKVQLEDYTTNELSKIGEYSSSKLNTKISKDALDRLASMSFGTPRLMNAFIKSLANYTIAKGIGTFGMNDLQGFLNYQGVDKIGLSLIDYKYLNCLYTNVLNGVRVPMGMKAICKRTGLTQDEVENIIEPRLLSLNYIMFSGRGRTLSDNGVEYTRVNVASKM